MLATGARAARNTDAADMLPISEPVPITDVPGFRLIRIEPVGPCLRLVFGMEQMIAGTDEQELTITAKILIAASALHDLAHTLMSAGTCVM